MIKKVTLQKHHYIVGNKIYITSFSGIANYSKPTLECQDDLGEDLYSLYKPFQGNVMAVGTSRFALSKILGKYIYNK